MKALKAKDVMTTEVVTVRDDLTLGELTDVLMENEISGAPVVDSEGSLVGVVSVMDVARQSSNESTVGVDQGNPEFFVRGWEEKFSLEELGRLRVHETGSTVRDVMTPALFTVAESDPIADVARTLVDGHIHRVLVTRDSELIGIISSLDLLRAYLDNR